MSSMLTTLLLPAERIGKYSEDQPRDANGRWGSGAGGAKAETASWKARAASAAPGGSSRPQHQRTADLHSEAAKLHTFAASHAKTQEAANQHLKMAAGHTKSAAFHQTMANRPRGASVYETARRAEGRLP